MPQVLAFYFYWTALVQPPLATAVPHGTFSPAGGPPILQTSQRQLEACPEAPLPDSSVPHSPRSPFRLSSAYTSAVPSRRLLDCEPGGAPQRLWSPWEKQGAPVRGWPWAVLSREQCLTTLAGHPSLHSGPNIPLAYQALPAQVHAHN